MGLLLSTLEYVDDCVEGYLFGPCAEYKNPHAIARVDFPFQRGAKHLHWKREREEKCLYEEKTMVPAHE